MVRPHYNSLTQANPDIDRFPKDKLGAFLDQLFDRFDLDGNGSSQDLTHQWTNGAERAGGERQWFIR